MMAYKIEYDRGHQKKKVDKAPSWRLPVLILAFFMLFLFCVEQTRPEATAAVRAWLLPESTRQAVQTLLEDLRGGDEISQAVSVFCQDIFGYE